MTTLSPSDGQVLLSIDRTDVEQLVVESLDWAEEWFVCAPFIDLAPGRSRLWSAVHEDTRTLKGAYVGVEGMRTHPRALDMLAATGALRLVPLGDGAFHPGLLFLRRGRATRTIIGSVLTTPWDGSPWPFASLWEGPGLGPASVQARALLARLRRVSYVPSREQLDEYAVAFQSADAHWDSIVAAGAGLVRRTAADHDVPGLHLVTGARAIKNAQRQLETTAKEQATITMRQTIGYQGGNMTFPVRWIAPLGIWVGTLRLHNRYWNGFGTDRPAANKSLGITVEINVPVTGCDRRIAGGFAVAEDTAEMFLVHRGRIGGGRAGIGGELFWKRFRGGVPLREPDGEEPRRVAIVGKLGSPEFLREVAAFVHEVRRMKAEPRARR